MHVKEIPKSNIQKYQFGKVLKWLGTSLDDGVRFIRKPFVARHYAKMGVDVTAPQNKRIIASLSGLDFGNNLQMDIPTWTLRRSLIDQGVDPRLLSELNLYKLINKRINALDLGLNFPSKYAVRYDLGFDNFPMYEYHLFRSTPLGGRKAGAIHISTLKNGNNSIDMITNHTSGRSRVSGISEQGYNAATQDLGDIISGEILMAPHITTKVWEKFPKKTLLGNYGKHHYPDATAGFEYGPVWRLETPTYQQPIKFGNNFDVMSITPNGRFTVDFNKGSMFKNGGKIEKHQLGKIIRPIKKGIKNIQTYLEYTKNPENFYGPVKRTLDHYMTRYPALQANYFSRDLYGPFTLNTFTPKLNIPEISIKKNPFSGSFGQYSNDNKIVLYPYSFGSIVNAWKNPKKAIYHMNGVAAHEGAHSALNQLGIQLTKYSPKTKYYIADPHGLLYDDLTYAFDSRGSNWLKSPEEFVAEMSYLRERSNAKPGFGFSQWAPNQQKQGIRFLSKEFDFTPEDTEYFLHKFSQLGFKHGGKIKNPQQ